MALPCPYGLDESQLLGLIVDHSYEGFIPVRNATAGLDSYELMSIMMSGKRKRDDNKVFGAAFKKIKSVFWAGNENASPERAVNGHQLYPAEVFDDPTRIPDKSVEPKKIGEQRCVLHLQNTSEWSAEYMPSSPPPESSGDQVNAPRQLSLKWKTDEQAPSIDLGNIYEKKVTRSETRKWLAEHEGQINQEDLKDLNKTSNLFIIDHVLYSEKIVIEHGSSSGEKSLAAGPVSASATFETKVSRGAATIRPADVGRKPIAFKVSKLLTRKSKKIRGKTRNGLRLILAPLKPNDLEPKNIFSGCCYADSSPVSSSGKSFFSLISFTGSLADFIKISRNH